MLRTVVFWLHLVAGVTVGLVIVAMSVTGVLLTYERQLADSSTSQLRSQSPASGASPLPVDTLLTRVAGERPDLVPLGLTLRAGADSPVVVRVDRAPLFVDAYSGRIIGEQPGGGLPAFLAKVRSWHRWLAMEGEGRSVGRAITGWSNLVFLVIVLSGIYLWLPRTWMWAQVKQVAFFRRHPGSSKARDFNWHNVIGIWSSIPLAIIVLGAVPISFPWANDLVYRSVGDEPPPRRGPERSGARGAARRPSWSGLGPAVERAVREQADWQTIAVRFPPGTDEPFSFTIDRGTGGQPQLRSTVTVDRSGRVVAREAFADQSPGRRLRSVLRFAHTGEVLGIVGQTVAGLVSAAAVVMVWTGLALTWRRWRAAFGRAGVAPETVVPGLSRMRIATPTTDGYQGGQCGG